MKLINTLCITIGICSFCILPIFGQTKMTNQKKRQLELLRKDSLISVENFINLKREDKIKKATLEVQKRFGFDENQFRLPIDTLFPDSIDLHSTSNLSKQAMATISSLVEEELNKKNNDATEAIEMEEKEIRTLKEKIDKLETKTIKLAFSVGPRWISEKDHIYRSYLDQSNWSLKIDTITSSSFLFSTGIIITPGENSTFLHNRQQFLKGVGGNYPSSGNRWARFVLLLAQNMSFVANINLIEFSSNREKLAFNKQIDGGIGVGMKIGEKVYLAFTREWFNVRELRSFYRLKATAANSDDRIIMVNKGSDSDGNQILEPLTVLDASDNNYFHDETKQGWSFKILLGF